MEAKKDTAGYDRRGGGGSSTVVGGEKGGTLEKEELVGGGHGRLIGLQTGEEVSKVFGGETQ